MIIVFLTKSTSLPVFPEEIINYPTYYFDYLIIIYNDLLKVISYSNILMSANDQKLIRGSDDAIRGLI